MRNERMYRSGTGRTDTRDHVRPSFDRNPGAPGRYGRYDQEEYRDEFRTDDRDQRARGREFGEDNGRQFQNNSRNMSGYGYSNGYGDDFEIDGPTMGSEARPYGPSHSRDERAVMQRADARDLAHEPYGGRNGAPRRGFMTPQADGDDRGHSLRSFGQRSDRDSSFTPDWAQPQSPRSWYEGRGEERTPRGAFAGRGPKGWQRSDERLRDDVSEALARHSEIDASDIEIEVSGSEITLKGTVPDRHTKRLAEEVAEEVFGVKDVQNQLRVQSSNGTPTDRPTSSWNNDASSTALAKGDRAGVGKKATLES
jgi:hypothetical protein